MDTIRLRHPRKNSNNHLVCQIIPLHKEAASRHFNHHHPEHQYLCYCLEYYHHRCRHGWLGEMVMARVIASASVACKLLNCVTKFSVGTREIQLLIQSIVNTASVIDAFTEGRYFKV